MEAENRRTIFVCQSLLSPVSTSNYVNGSYMISLYRW